MTAKHVNNDNNNATYDAEVGETTTKMGMACAATMMVLTLLMATMMICMLMFFGTISPIRIDHGYPMMMMDAKMVDAV